MRGTVEREERAAMRSSCTDGVKSSTRGMSWVETGEQEGRGEDGRAVG